MWCWVAQLPTGVTEAALSRPHMSSQEAYSLLCVHIWDVMERLPRLITPGDHCSFLPFQVGTNNTARSHLGRISRDNKVLGKEAGGANDIFIHSSC